MLACERLSRGYRSRVCKDATVSLLKASLTIKSRLMSQIGVFVFVIDILCKVICAVLIFLLITRLLPTTFSFFKLEIGADVNITR